MKLQVGVKVFLKNKLGKYLLVKRSELKYPNVKGRWDIVGGRINSGVKLIENLKREVKEEVGLKILNQPVLIYAQDIIIPPEGKHVVRLSYTGDTKGEPVLDLSEHTEYKWLTPKEISKQKGLDIYVKEIIKEKIIK